MKELASEASNINNDATTSTTPKVSQEIRDYFMRCDAEIYKKNQFIYRESNASDMVFYVEKGQVIISEINEEEREVIKCILRPGEIFGEQGLADVLTREERARVKGETLVRGISIEQLRQDMINDINLTMQINKAMIGKLYNIQERWKSQVSQVARDRIIDFVLDIVKKDGKKVGFEHVVRNTLTHMEIANFLGTSRQTVTVVLNELRDKDLLYFDRKRLLIRELDNLKVEKGA